MYGVPQVGPRRPAVAGPVVQRGVRPHGFWPSRVVLERFAVRPGVAGESDGLPCASSSRSLCSSSSRRHHPGSERLFHRMVCRTVRHTIQVVLGDGQIFSGVHCGSRSKEPT